MEKHTVFKAYFGRDIKGISTVTRMAFHLFLAEFVASKIGAFNVIDSMGVWKGTKESGFILEVLIEGSDQEAALTGHQLTRVAEDYKREFDQDAVLITRQEIDAVFV